MFNNYNPYYNYMQPQIPRVDTPFTQPPAQQPAQPMYKQNIGLQGKSVDSLEVVKATDIPLDGSVSYFPLLDGSAIVTKQLQQDGTSKMVIYKPIEAEEATSTKYATVEDIESRIKDLKIPDMKPLQDDIKTLKKQIRILLDKEE